jgi:branched-chain amino acid transport system permease protein
MDLCGALPYGVRRRVELARALAIDPAVLLLDEPAAGLNETEQLELAAALRRCARDGVTLVIVEHNMPFLLPLATRMICLDAGRLLAQGSPDAVSRDPAVIEAYLGTPLVGLA